MAPSATRLNVRGKAALATLVAVSCGVMGVAQSDLSALKVTDVRFWSLGDITRVAIQTNGEFRYRSDRLPGPDRLFFDLLGAKPALGTGGMHTIPVGDKLLKQIRVAETQPGVTRVVLDLEDSVGHVASQLSNPDRLVVELRHVGLKPGPSAERSVTGGKKLAEPGRPVETAKSGVAAAPPPEKKAPAAARPEVVKPAQPPPGKELREPPKAATVAQPPKPTSAGSAEEAVAEPAKRNRSGGRSLTRALGLKVGRVLIDPGHGGHDTGTIGPGGLIEKELVLDVARRLGALIGERMGSEVIYTRTGDTFVSLEERTRMANEKQADLFLSVHANSSPYQYVSGAETFYLNFTTSRASLDLAARENAPSQKSIHELQELIRKIALRDKVEESREFAARVQMALCGVYSRNPAESKNRGVKKAPFVVLIGAAMPSVLAEVGFLSNPREEILLKKPEQRQKIADALFTGLSQYAATLSHFQVARRTTP